MIEFSSSGSFKNIEKFLKVASEGELLKNLDGMGQLGVEALRANTPVDTGATAFAWTYTVSKNKGNYSISWNNSRTVSGVPLIILLQYGHGTGTGGYVQGVDIINSALRPVFEKIENDFWEALTRA